LAKKRRKPNLKNPNSMTWRKKADRLVTKLFTGQPCMICKSLGKINTYKTCGHHIVAKSLSAQLRHELLNIIPLCEEHHNFSVEIAPHSKYQPAQKAFLNWLEAISPDRYELLLTYKRYSSKKVDYRKRCEELQGYLDNPPFGEDILYKEIFEKKR